MNVIVLHTCTVCRAIFLLPDLFAWLCCSYSLSYHWYFMHHVKSLGLFLLVQLLVSVNVFNTLLSNVTGVRLFLGEENVTIANFSMIAAGLFHEEDVDSPDGIATYGIVGPDGQNDGLWCQSSLNQNMIGTWYHPDGTTVPLDSGSPLFANNTATGQIGLLRNGGIGSIQGLYSCTIPNEEGINETLYVAAYGNTDFLQDGGELKI